jgi:hypothetical protein
MDKKEICPKCKQEKNYFMDRDRDIFASVCCITDGVSDDIEKLKRDSLFLHCLKEVGVNNFDPGYSQAWFIFNLIVESEGE